MHPNKTWKRLHQNQTGILLLRTVMFFVFLLNTFDRAQPVEGHWKFWSGTMMKITSFLSKPGWVFYHDACNTWISSKMINYFKWKALISFMGEKERKNTSEEKKKTKKICTFATLRLELSTYVQDWMQVLFNYYFIFGKVILLHIWQNCVFWCLFTNEDTLWFSS